MSGMTPGQSSKLQDAGVEDLIALYKGCLSAGMWKRLICTFLPVIPSSKNGSDSVTCCSLYKIR